MMAANYRHIGGLENRLGRHYSRFSTSWAAAPLAAQSLARRKLPNHGSNRRSQVSSPYFRCRFPKQEHKCRDRERRVDVGQRHLRSMTDAKSRIVDRMVFSAAGLTAGLDS